MSLRKLFLFSVATLALLTGASAQNIQVDGLQAEEVNASFGDREVTFTASYLNKSITYGKLLVPDELRDDLVDVRSNGRVRTVVDGVGIFQPPGQQDRRLSLAYKFRNDASVPELQGWQYGEFSGNRNSGLKPKNGEATVLLDTEGRDRVFTSNFSDQGVRWNITVNSHYEHLIVNYDLIYNESGQPAEIVWETRDVYSGEEPDKVTFGANAEQISNSGLTKNITYDNMYDTGPDYEVLNIVVPDSANITQIDWRGLESQEIDFNYSVAESELESAGVDPSLVLDSLEGYKVRSYNTTFPSDSNETVTVDIEYKNPLSEEQGRLKVEEPPEFYTYIIGSGGALKINSTTSMWGNHSYESVLINSTLYVDSYNGTSGTGKLNITADNWINITSNGAIDAEGMGYSGAGDYSDTTGSWDGKSGSGPGAGYGGSTSGGKSDNAGGGGASHFNLGQDGYDIGVSAGSQAGTYGNLSDLQSLTLGSGGGGGAAWTGCDDDFGCSVGGTSQGGDGGGGVILRSSYIRVDGTVDVSGRDGSRGLHGAIDDGECVGLSNRIHKLTAAAGGGSGGKAILYAKNIDIFGEIDAKGGEHDRLTYWGNGDRDSVTCNGYTTSRGGDGADGGVAIVYGKNSQLNGKSNVLGLTHTTTKSFNSPPIISSTEVVVNKHSDVSELKFGINDKGESDIADFAGLNSAKLFTNSSLVSDISLPLSTSVSVSDSAAASSGSRNIDLSESDSGLRQSSYSHTLNDQRINRTVEIFNNAASSIDYNLTLQDYGTVIQGESWNGTIPASGSVQHTGVWENDWITGETESSYDKYEDSGFDHGEDEQVLVNQTRLVVDNSRSFQFSSVDVSSVCGRATTGDVPSGQGVTVTTDCNRPTFTVDFINESNSSLLGDRAFGHDLGTQGVSRRKNLTETGGYSWTGVNVSSPEMPGSCVNCGQREVDVAADSTSSVYYNSTGGWIDSSVEVFEKGQYGVADLDQQSFYNQTSLEASNSQSFRFHSVDLSSKCSVTTSGDVPPGSSTVTTACTNSTFSGDWIQNEVNESTRYQEGGVVIGDGVSELYRAGQNVSVENTRSDVNLSVDFSGQLVEEQGCSVVDSVRRVSASTSAEFSFEKLCSPGEVVSHEPVEKTETATDFKYTYRGDFEVYSNLTEEEPITFAVERSRLSNFEERLPTETEVYVDGRGSGLSVGQRYFNDTEYVTVEVPDDFGNSSLHEGSHSVKLVYYESKSPGGTSGGGSTGGGVVGGGGSQPQETVENVTGEYNWTVSAAVASDTQKFTVARAPGDTFEKQILLENTGSEEVPLNISCTSQDEFCRYVDLEVDRVVLNTGSFNQKQVTVTGNVPGNASAGSSYTFRILVEDPSSTGLGSEGAATVDFLVTVSDFFGGIVSYANKLTEWRELESPFGIGNPIPYPFALLPLLSAAVVGVAVLGIRRLLEIESSALVQASHFGLIVLTFLVSVPLWP